MRPSISTLYFRELDPRPAVQLFARHGWADLELSECHASQLLAQGDPTLAGRRFREFAADHGVSFVQGHLPVVWYSGTDADESGEAYFDVAPESDHEWARAMDVVESWIDLFRAVGVRLGVLHMGGFGLKDAGWSDGAVFERRVKALSEIADSAARAEMTICLENLSVPNCGVESLEQIRALIAAAGADNLAICADTGHAVLAGQDCAEFILGGGDLVKALHVHDNDGTRDEHALPYEGNSVPWDRVLEVLRRTEYSGLLNLEIVGRPWCPMPVREARLAYARALAYHMTAEVLPSGHRGAGA